MGCPRAVLDVVWAQVAPDDIALREAKAWHEAVLLAVWEHGAVDLVRRLIPDPAGVPGICAHLDRAPHEPVDAR